MQLWIAEKPSLARGIAAHLGRETNKGDGYIEIDGGKIIMTWSIGHIFEQVEPDAYLSAPTPDMLNKNGKRKWSRADLPIIPQKWRLRATNAKQFKVIRDLAKKADEIVGAGDPDAEGQSLVDEILVESGINPDGQNVKRVWLAALDEASVKKAIANLKPNSEYKNLRERAICRSRADWLIGMNCTRGFTLSGNGGLVAVGRVQTPTLGMVVRRDLMIRNFKPVDYYVPYVVMPDGTKLEWVGCKSDVRDGLDPEGRIVKKELADRIMNEIRAGLEYKVTMAESREVQEKPPLPHSLDSLQVQLSKTHKMSAQRTLDAAQALYETHKLTTYPRSDCRYLPQSMFDEREKVLEGVAGRYGKEVGGANTDLKSGCWNDSKITAHHALIPTGQPQRGQLNNDEQAAYDAIVKGYVVQFYPNARYMKNELELLFGGEDRFRAAEKALVYPGWKVVMGAGIEEAKEEIGPETRLDKGMNIK